MNAALLPEYSARSAESAVNAKKIRRSVFRLTRVYLWLFVIAVVVINLQYFFMGPESAEYDDFLYPGYSLGRSLQAEVMHLMYINSVLGMAGSIGTAMLLFASIKEGLGKFESDVNAGRVTEMQPTQGVSIREMTEALATDMGILPYNQIRFWKTLSKARYPSVQQLGGGDVNIVVPVNYFLFHQKHPERSKAILAHELGHVLQGDTDLYLLSEKFYTVVRLVVVPMLLLTLISVLVMLAMSGGPQGGLVPVITSALSVIVPVFFIIFYLGQYGRIRALRSESEHLADMCAFIYAEGDALLRVLEGLEAPARRSNIVHPPRQERIDYIQQLEKSQIPSS